MARYFIRLVDGQWYRRSLGDTTSAEVAGSAAQKDHIRFTSDLCEEVELLSDKITIGRGEGNDIVVDDELVAKRHCILEHQGGAYHIKDQNTLNGTYVRCGNIEFSRVTETIPIEGDAEIRIGRTLLKIYEGQHNTHLTKKSAVSQ